MDIRIFIIAAAIAAVPISAIAQAETSPTGSMPPYDWVKRPKAKKFDYPKDAWRAGLFVLAKVKCTVIDTDGKLKCVSEMEAPPGHGMAKSIVKHMEQNFRLQPKNGGESLIGTTQTKIFPAKLKYVGTHSDGDYDFRSLPTDAELNQLYPAEAMRDRQTAMVLAHCKIKDAAGRVECDEKTIYSTTPNYGFEAAAKKALEEHAIAARYYRYVTNADGTKGRIYPPFIIGQLRQTFVSFTLPGEPND